MSTIKNLSLDRRLLVGVGLLLLVLGIVGADQLRSPQMVYREAKNAPAWRARALYQRLARRLPEIEEYFQLETARTEMPGVDAFNTLQAIIAARPHSPAAYEAHLILARYYAASGESAAAEEAYRAALALEESPSLWLELARYLAEVGHRADAYAEFRTLLGDLPDAFAGMRRYGDDPLQTASDLDAAGYYSDVLETLRGLDDVEAIPLRAQALAGLGLYDQAVEEYEAWLRREPDDVGAQLGLASALVGLGRSEEALKLYQSMDSPAALPAAADLLAEQDPEAALELYKASEDPIAWWTATSMLEERGQQSEALDLYERIAAAGVYVSDDAAYRMWTLARRQENARLEREALRLLNEQGLTYLGLQAQGDEWRLPIAPAYDPLPTENVRKAEALEQLGLDQMAQRELVMAARFDPRPEVAAAAAQALSERGEVIEAQSIAEGLLNENPRRPLLVWRLAYPKPYLQIVQAEAHTSGVSPPLIWAVMREESRFDPEALSFANAQGLMQVIPSTRDSIAEQLGEAVRADAMFDPETSIRFGASYLGSLLQAFDSDVELAVAAYNGGPGSVSAWLDDPMVETRGDFYRWIGFGESREYLTRVMLSYRIYQRLDELDAANP